MRHLILVWSKDGSGYYLIIDSSGLVMLKLACVTLVLTLSFVKSEAFLFDPLIKELVWFESPLVHQSYLRIKEMSTGFSVIKVLIQL